MAERNSPQRLAEPSREYSLRECGANCAEKLALVGSASFLEAFAGILEGKDILAQSGLPIIPANDLGDAAKKIVAEVKAPVAA